MTNIDDKIIEAVETDSGIKALRHLNAKLYSLINKRKEQLEKDSVLLVLEEIRVTINAFHNDRELEIRNEIYARENDIDPDYEAAKDAHDSEIIAREKGYEQI